MKAHFSFDYEFDNEQLLQSANNDVDNLRNEAVNEGLTEEQAIATYPYYKDIDDIPRNEMIHILFSEGWVDEAFDNISYNDICIN